MCSLRKRDIYWCKSDLTARAWCHLKQSCGLSKRITRDGALAGKGRNSGAVVYASVNAGAGVDAGIDQRFAPVRVSWTCARRYS